MVEIANAQGFQELYVALRQKGGLTGSSRHYDASELISRIEDYRECEASEERELLRRVTRAKGLRQKVRSLKHENTDDRFAQVLKNSSRGHESAIDIDFKSGWKLHVFGDEWQDSYQLAKLLHSVIDEYGAAYKVATARFHDEVDPSDDQHGKTMTIYLPPSLFIEGEAAAFITDIIQRIEQSSYDKKGVITGDKKITDQVCYRYSCSVPMPLFGFEFYDRDFYRSNDGSYNIDGNPDLIDIVLNGNRNVDEVVETAQSRLA